VPDEPDITSMRARPAATEVVGRPPELEDFLNARIFHPLAWRLALALRNTFVTPNQVSILGGLIVVVAAATYAGARAWPLTAFAFLLHLSWHVFDGADGDLARMTGRSSRQGEIVDGICDYVSHIVLYITLGWLLAAQIGPAGWCWAAAAGAARIIQAVFYENQRRQYQFWVYGSEWLRVSAEASQPNGSLIDWVGRSYARAGAWLTPSGARVDPLVSAAEEIDKTKLRRLIRAEYAFVLRIITPLNANYRTTAIGLAMLAGSPLYAFIFEAIALSLWLFWSALVARRACLKIVDQAEAIISR